MKRITDEQARAMRLLADGWSYDRIAMIIWGCANEDGTVDDEKLRRKKKLLGEWFRDPRIKEAYNEIIRSELLPPIIQSIKRLEKQVNDDNEKNGWLSNKAANDILTRYGSILFGEEDKTIKIQIEGMPELGEPDD